MNKKLKDTQGASEKIRKLEKELDEIRIKAHDELKVKRSPSFSRVQSPLAEKLQEANSIYQKIKKQTSSNSKTDYKNSENQTQRMVRKPTYIEESQLAPFPRSNTAIKKESLSKSKQLFFAGLGLLTLLVLWATGYFFTNGGILKRTEKPISWEECLKAKGSIIQESYPRVCVTKDGQKFVEPVTTEAPTLTPFPSPTANWTLYTSEDFGFELKHPKDWETIDYLSDKTLPTLEFFKAGSTQGKPPGGFEDGAGVKIFPQKQNKKQEEEILLTLKSYGEPTEFNYEDWIGFRSTSVIEDGTKMDAIFVSKESPTGRTVELFWLHFDPSNNGLEAEKFLFPTLSTFRFLDLSGEEGGQESEPNNSCIITGCNSELCVDESESDLVSICLYLPEYECYKTATCEKQESGECGWTLTEELQECLAED